MGATFDDWLPPVATAASMGSGVLQSIGARKSGKAAKKASQINARSILDQSSSAAARIRRAGRQEIGRQRAMAGASGLQIAGSPLELIAANAQEIERQALEETLAGQREASIERTRGETAMSEARRISAASLLEGGIRTAYLGRRLY